MERELKCLREWDVPSRLLSFQTWGGGWRGLRPELQKGEEMKTVLLTRAVRRDRNRWPTINSRAAAISSFVTAVFIREVVSPVAEFVRWYWRRRMVAAEKTPTQRVKPCTWGCFATVPQQKGLFILQEQWMELRACSSQDFWLMEKLSALFPDLI